MNWCHKTSVGIHTSMRCAPFDDKTSVTIIIIKVIQSPIWYMEPTDGVVPTQVIRTVLCQSLKWFISCANQLR